MVLHTDGPSDSDPQGSFVVVSSTDNTRTLPDGNISVSKLVEAQNGYGKHKAFSLTGVVSPKGIINGSGWFASTSSRAGGSTRATLLGAYVEGAVSSNCTAYGWGAKPPKRTASITISGGKITTGATTREIKKKENPCERGTNFCTTAVWLKASEFTNGSSQDVTIRTKVDYGDQAKDSGKSFVVHANRKGYAYPSYYTFPRGYLPLPSLPWAGHADRDSHFDEKLAKYYDAHGWYYGKGWEAHHILQLDHCSGYYRCNDPGGNGWFLPESQHDVVSAWWANVEEVS